jgi:hypothetical protein
MTMGRIRPPANVATRFTGIATEGAFCDEQWIESAVAFRANSERAAAGTVDRVTKAVEPIRARDIAPPVVSGRVAAGSGAGGRT